MSKHPKPVCTKCKKRPIQIQKYEMCRACYVRARRHGEISNAPVVSETEIGRSVLSAIDGWRKAVASCNEQLNRQAAANQDLNHQLIKLTEENTTLKERILQLNNELNSKKVRAVKLTDLTRLITP